MATSSSDADNSVIKNQNYDSSPSCEDQLTSVNLQKNSTNVLTTNYTKTNEHEVHQIVDLPSHNENCDYADDNLMTNDVDISESELPQIVDSLSLNENEDNAEENYVAIWEEDESDPLEMLMISKDSEQISSDFKSETGNLEPKSDYLEPKSDDLKPVYDYGNRERYCQERNRFRGRQSSHRCNHSRYVSSYQNSYTGGKYYYDGYNSKTSLVYYQSRNFKSSHKRHNGPWVDDDKQSILPSDSASQIDQGSNISPNCHNSCISAIDLAQALSEFEKFCTSLLTLLEKYNFDHREVKRIVNNNSNIFELKEEIVSLKPKFQVCKSHLGIKGCSYGAECSDLHICPNFINNACDSKNCLMGHFWKTNHNLEILKAYSLATFQIPTLNKLFLSVSLGNDQMTNDLQICLDYNLGKCQKHDCSNLHLCLSFLAKLCASKDKCQLHHNPLHKDVSSILVRHGISVNESPKDVLLIVTQSPLIKQEINKFNSGGDSSLAKASSNEISYSLGRTEKDRPDSNRNTDVENSGPKGNKIVLKNTTWSYNFLGEVKIPEICYDSVENYCNYEEAGCWRLHCNQHFHWQVCETGKPWVNLRDFQVLTLETAFCDPQINKVDVPPLDPSKLDSLIKPLLVTMQGRTLWEADFEKMMLLPKKQDTRQITSKPNRPMSTALELRRLCTEHISNKVPEPCIFAWYFLDKNKKWVEYGQVDSTGDTSLICDVKSTDIEKHHRQRPNSPLAFLSSRFNYIIDTLHCVQLNLDTNVSRAVRRRPCCHLKKANSFF